MLMIDAAADEPARDLCPVWYRAHDLGSDEAVVVAPSIGALVQECTRALESGRGSYVPQTDQWALDFETLLDGFDRPCCSHATIPRSASGLTNVSRKRGSAIRDDRGLMAVAGGHTGGHKCQPPLHDTTLRRAIAAPRPADTRNDSACPSSNRKR